MIVCNASHSLNQILSSCQYKWLVKYIRISVFNLINLIYIVRHFHQLFLLITDQEHCQYNVILRLTLLIYEEHRQYTDILNLTLVIGEEHRQYTVILNLTLITRQFLPFALFFKIIL